MELRLDHIAYMIIAAHLIHSKVDLHPYSKADNNDLGTEKKNPGNWHTVCYTYTGNFFYMNYSFGFHHTTYIILTGGGAYVRFQLQLLIC